jgi:hypothetical protein
MVAKFGDQDTFFCDLTALFCKVIIIFRKKIISSEFFFLKMVVVCTSEILDPLY